MEETNPTSEHLHLTQDELAAIEKLHDHVASSRHAGERARLSRVQCLELVRAHLVGIGRGRLVGRVRVCHPDVEVPEPVDCWEKMTRNCRLYTHNFFHKCTSTGL
jgi:hypothetical protein